MYLTLNLITQRSLETQLWLSDAAIRLLCVLALDRFADFISDQVICYQVYENHAATYIIVVVYIYQIIIIPNHIFIRLRNRDWKRDHVSA